MWQNLGYDEDSYMQLLTEMRAWKRKEAPYNILYDKNRENPEKWWLTINVDKNNDQLQQLALQLYNISPSQAICERNFSILKWFYGNYRTKLNILRIEAMAKIRLYYISNSNKELKYYGKTLSKNELKNNIFNSSITNVFLENNNTLENEINESEISQNNNLEIGDIVNLSSDFILSFENNNSNQSSNSRRNIGNMNYNVNTLIENFINNENNNNNSNNNN
jgi:hypothetical protein